MAYHSALGITDGAQQMIPALYPQAGHTDCRHSLSQPKLGLAIAQHVCDVGGSEYAQSTRRSTSTTKLSEWKSSGRLSPYVSDALRRKKGVLRFRCCRKLVSGAVSGVATADPAMPHDVISVPHNCRLESDTAIVVRNPAINHNSMQVVTVR